MFNSATFLSRITFIWLTLLSLSLIASPSQPVTDNSDFQSAHLRKAEYVFNFTRYINWPDLSERDLRYQITLCLQSRGGSFDVIEGLAKVHKVGERQLTVQVRLLSPGIRCDLIYIEQAWGIESQISTEMLRQVAQEVVIVAAKPDLYPELSAISFYQRENRLSFEVNMNIINRLKADVSSELLKLARIRQIPVKQQKVATIQDGEQD